MAGDRGAADADAVLRAAAGPLRPAYYVYGPAEGEAAARFLLDRVRERVREIAGPELQVERVEGEGAWQAAAHRARALTLGGRRLVVAAPEGEPTPAAAEALARALAAPAPGTTLFVREPPALAPRTGAAAALRRGPWAVAARAPDRRQAPAWLLRAGEAMGVRWGAGAAAFLYTRVGEDMLLALSEAAKLRDVLAPDGEVDRAAVERLTPAAVAARIHPVGEAYLAGDTAAALRAAHDALEAGTSPFAVAGYLARQVRLLRQAQAVAAEAGGRVDLETLARALSLAPWQARPFASALARGRPDPRGAFAALLAADLDMKGRMPPSLALDRLILALTQAGPA
ncbi:MAG: hypothetical protein K6V73_10570 [Firmicutes bacterium]|nr:hypothetical protein [Bacillota bacterium]